MSIKAESNPDILINPVRLSVKDIASINKLLSQLSKNPPELNGQTIQDIINQPNFNWIVFIDPESDEIIGMASFFYSKTFMTSGGIGRIEDVVIDERYHGHGFGDLIVKYLMSMANVLGLAKLELTSNSSRQSANALYLKHGFKKRETNCYVMELK